MSGSRENRGDDQEFPPVSVENSRTIALLRSLLRSQKPQGVGMSFKKLAPLPPKPKSKQLPPPPAPKPRKKAHKPLPKPFPNDER
jgi:hypothetical protein